MSASLPTYFYTMPRHAHGTFDRKELRKILLSNGGQITANGELYDVKTKHLGAGVYKVWLEHWQPREDQR